MVLQNQQPHKAPLSTLLKLMRAICFTTKPNNGAIEIRLKIEVKRFTIHHNQLTREQTNKKQEAAPGNLPLGSKSIYRCHRMGWFFSSMPNSIRFIADLLWSNLILTAAFLFNFCCLLFSPVVVFSLFLWIHVIEMAAQKQPKS